MLEELFQFTRAQLLSRDIHLDVADLTPLPSVRVDVDQFRQVAINLVANAADAVVERYGTQAHPNRRITVVGHIVDSGVTLHMRDYGAGIPYNVVDRIFEPFYTTKVGGLGMGLSISKRLIEDQGGTLHFDTGPDGTRFYIGLPAP